jgi:putative DNA primase/helicase
MHSSIKFLNELDPRADATFNVETFTDLPKGEAKPKPDRLCTRRANLSLARVAEAIPELEELNSAGAAVFIAVNQFEGQRSKSNITRVRGVHADMDGVAPDKLDAIRERLRPTIEVQSSSPGNCHFYWLLNDGEEIDVTTAEAINRALVELGADKAAVDVSRLLRLPGFRHMKYRDGRLGEMTDQLDANCPMVKVVAGGPRYDTVILTRALLPKVQPDCPARAMVTSAAPSAPANLNTAKQALVRETVARMSAEHPSLWKAEYSVMGARRGGGFYESQSDADFAMAGYIAKDLASKVSSIEELEAIALEVMGQSGLAMRPKWQERAYYRERTITRACADIEIKPLIDWGVPGDVRNARGFANIWRDRLLFVHGRGIWYIWRKDRWQPCEQAEPIEAAKVVARTMLELASQELGKDPDRGRRLVNEAAKAHMEPRLAAMLKLAQSEPGMSVKQSSLDADPLLLGVRNGVVDLRMSFFFSNKPGLYITRTCDADFVRDAECPLWLKALDEIFEADPGTIASFQMLLGYTLTGLSSEEIIIFCVGFGANGKSILGNVTAAILGSYGKTAPSTMLAARRNDDHSARGDLAMLDGVRLVSINELPGGMQLDEQVVKQLAGREAISARFLHKEFFSFVPRFTPWVRTNHKPIIKGDDDGIWRRIIVLPFRRKFEEHERDPRLEEKLLSERDGILRWMIEGARLYLQGGLKLSKNINQEQAKYRKESDLLGEFLEVKTIQDTEDRVEQRRLFSSWEAWCRNNGLYSGSKKAFTQRLNERGYASIKSNSDYYYAGLCLPINPVFE